MRTIMIWAAAGALLGLLGSRPAHAEDSQQADETFHAGRELLKDKRYADACPKFEESQRQDPASGTLLALAYCQDLSGLLATSWTNYIAAAQLAEQEGHPDRQAAATERAQALAPRLSRLTVLVPQELLSLPGFHLLRDGIEFERASFNLPVATNGGSHAFEASAPGRMPWTSTVTLQNERDNKTLVLPILDPIQSGPSAGAARFGANNGPPPLLDERDLEADRQATTLKRASLAFAVGSLVGIGLGTAFAFSAQSKNDASNANGHCDGRGCDARGIQLRNDALGAARDSTWSFIAGGALAACSITLYVTASSVSSSSSSTGAPRRATRVEGTMSLGAPSVTVTGSF
jgi:hypothetical protein